MICVAQEVRGQRAVALLHHAKCLVRAVQPVDGVLDVGEERRVHQHDPVPVGPGLLLGANGDGDLRHERVDRQLVVLHQPPPNGACA